MVLDAFQKLFGYHGAGFGCFVFRLSSTNLPSTVLLRERAPLECNSVSKPMVLEILPAPLIPLNNFIELSF